MRVYFWKVNYTLITMKLTNQKVRRRKMEITNLSGVDSEYHATTVLGAIGTEMRIQTRPHITDNWFDPTTSFIK